MEGVWISVCFDDPVLCHDPEIIIFDEPTNGLDVLAAKDVEEFLSKMKDDNHIILISTHI